MPLPGDDIRARRKRLEWTQKELATVAGVNPETVTRVEANLNARLNTIEQLRGALHVEEVKRFGGILAREIEKRAAGTEDVEPLNEDSWRGDVLKAIATLNRALRRSEMQPSEPWDGITERRTGTDRRVS